MTHLLHIYFQHYEGKARCRLHVHYSFIVPHLLNDNTASLSCVVAEYSLVTLSIAAGVTLQLSSMSIGGGHVVP